MPLISAMNLSFINDRLDKTYRLQRFRQFKLTKHRISRSLLDKDTLSPYAVSYLRLLTTSMQTETIDILYKDVS